VNSGFCSNIPENCTKAKDRTPIPLLGVVGAQCPECSSPLTTQRGASGFDSKWIVLGVAGLLLVGWGVWHLLKLSGVISQDDIDVGIKSDTKFLLRMSGSNTIGAKLAPELMKSWLQSMGASDIGVNQIKVDGKFVPETVVSASLNKQQVQFEIRAHGSGEAFKHLKEKSADIGMSSREVKTEEIASLAALGNMKGRASEHVLALDGIAVIVAPSNPLASIGKQELMGVFCGKTDNWEHLNAGHGGINVYVRPNNSGTFDTFKHLVCGSKPLVASAKAVEDSAELEAAVARDPAGIGFIGLPYVKTAKALAVSDGSESVAFAPTTLTIKKEYYALSRRLFFYTPANSENPYVNQFINYALSPAGQSVVRSVGFVDLSVVVPEDIKKPDLLAGSSCKLSNNWRGEDRNKYCDIKATMKDLAVPFRFNTGSSELDNRAWQDLKRVLDALAGRNEPRQIQLVGFADAQGSYAANVGLSVDRALAVKDALRTLGLSNIEIVGFGQELPVRDNSNAEGREQNRRVEVWVK